MLRHLMAATQMQEKVARVAMTIQARASAVVVLVARNRVHQRRRSTSPKITRRRARRARRQRLKARNPHPRTRKSSIQTRHWRSCGASEHRLDLARPSQKITATPARNQHPTMTTTLPASPRTQKKKEQMQLQQRRGGSSSRTMKKPRFFNF
jgi:hypothetical protein